MNAEIIAVGSELLLGQITNTNARFISSQLSELGINVYYQTVVGDNSNRLLEAIKIAETRSDLIIFSGGLGPTKDDLTKETIAKHLHTDLVEDEFAMKAIEDFFAKRNRVMTANNRKQALVLKGCEVLVNKNGMAPGMIYDYDHRTYILLPGPPKEIEPMFQFEAKPKLLSRMHQGSKIVSHVLRFYGIGEAELEDKIQDLLDNQTNPTIAPLASDGEVTLRITANTENDEKAWKLINATKDKILDRVGKYFYGVDDDSLSSKIAEMLINNNLTIAAAESLTAGLFTSELAENTGIGQSLLGGMVTYNEQVKKEQLGMPKEILNEFGVVSAECAGAMAKLVREKFKSNIGVGLTGAAGPDAHGDQPAGTVWIGIAIDNDQPKTYQLHLSSMRNTNRLLAVKFAFHYIIQLLNEKGYSKI
ncbi:competence/damage-inducible protein A [Rummeliibacillus sp. JY-2-4R]